MTDTEHIRKTLDLFLSQIEEDERKISDKKRTVNELCRALDYAVRFPDVDIVSTGRASRPDEYYGRQMPDVIADVLEKRKGAQLGAATVAEIYSAMVQGGFSFQTKNEDYAKRGIYGILAKGGEFHKLPDGRYGLAAWYPAVRPKTEQQETKPKAGRKKGHGNKKKTSKTEMTASNGPPKLKKGSIRAIAAEVLKNAPGAKMSMDALMTELVKRGIPAKDNLRTIIYTGLIRRKDMFAKVGKGIFHLRRSDFVIED